MQDERQKIEQWLMINILCKLCREIHELRPPNWRCRGLSTLNFVSTLRLSGFSCVFAMFRPFSPSLRSLSPNFPSHISPRLLIQRRVSPRSFSGSPKPYYRAYSTGKTPPSFRILHSNTPQNKPKPPNLSNLQPSPRVSAASQASQRSQFSHLHSA
jgi:hypothetical protein